MGVTGDLRDFAYNMVVGARQNAQSISETDDLLRFSHRTISRVDIKCSEKEKISSKQQLCG